MCSERNTPADTERVIRAGLLCKSMLGGSCKAGREVHTIRRIYPLSIWSRTVKAVK